MERLRASLAVCMCLSLTVPSASAQVTPPSSNRPAPREPYRSGQLRGDERILHALNRFTFGPRPGDLEAVKSIGLEKWFIQQLHPETLDQSALEVRLAQFPAMQWSTEDLLYRLPSNAMIRQAADGKIAIPENGALRTIYLDEIARYQERQQKKAQKQQAALVANASSPAKMAQPEEGMTNPLPAVDAGAQQNVPVQAETTQTGMMAAADSNGLEKAPDEIQMTRILALPAAQRVTRLGNMTQPEFDNFRKALKGAQRIALTAGLSPAQKEVVGALEAPQRVVNEELVAQRLTRDIYSNAQLQEVMTDFWLNHFNVYLHKNDETPYYLVSYERDVIRPRALGKFEDLLEATAHSPAMLLYLDNSSSIGPDSPAAEKAKTASARRPEAKKQAPQGLNENYARELMELHTLGVSGGYTQADVTQVARVLTGWTVDRPQRGGGFKFDENRHEPGTKKVMGKKIKEHGELEGRALLHLLATRPATAKFLSRKLAIRFVGDDAPQALVDRMARTYLAKDGDISAVLTTLFHSPEFWSQSSYRAKIKTPLEYVVSAARATDADFENMQPLANALHDMGMPLYGAVPPTGYKWEAADWVSTGALVNRMNFALALAANKLPGIAITWNSHDDPSQANSNAARVDNGSGIRTFAPPVTNATASPSPTPEAEEQRLESLLVEGGVGSSTRAAVLDQFSEHEKTSPDDAAGNFPTPASKPMSAVQAANALEKQDQFLAGLLLGSPEFQRR